MSSAFLRFGLKGRTALKNRILTGDRKTDPGHPEVCTVFSYHKEFNGDFVKELQAACRAGEIGCVDCKKRMAKVVNDMLDPIRDRRAYYDEHPELVEDILRTGTCRAVEVGEQTLTEVKEAMNVKYFTREGAPAL